MVPVPSLTTAETLVVSSIVSSSITVTEVATVRSLVNHIDILTTWGSNYS